MKLENIQRTTKDEQKNRTVTGNHSAESGFSLIEAIIAILILTISLLAVVTIFAFSVRLNGGNNVRSQAIAVVQKEVEFLRSAKFVPGYTDPVHLSGGVKPVKPVTAQDNTSFRVAITVDDDPFAPGVQINDTKSIKEITVTVTPLHTGERFVNAIPTTVVLRRVRGN